MTIYIWVCIYEVGMAGMRWDGSGVMDVVSHCPTGGGFTEAGTWVDTDVPLFVPLVVSFFVFVSGFAPRRL
jgi:hypothetical protein